MKQLANKAFAQMENSLPQVYKKSNIYKEQKQEIFDLYDKADTLKNHIIMMDEYQQNVMIFTLAVQCNTLIEKLLS